MARAPNLTLRSIFTWPHARKHTSGSLRESEVSITTDCDTLVVCRAAAERSSVDPVAPTLNNAAARRRNLTALTSYRTGASIINVVVANSETADRRFTDFHVRNRVFYCRNTGANLYNRVVL